MGTVRSSAAMSKTVVKPGGVTLFLSTAVAAASASLLEGSYESPLLDAVLTTAQPILAFSVAYLLFLRFGRTHRWSDLLLLHAISLLGFAHVFFNPYTGVELDGFEVPHAPVLTCYFIVATTVALAALVQTTTAGKTRGTKGLVILSTSLAATVPLVLSMLATVGAAGNSAEVSIHQPESDLARAGVVYVLLIAAGACFGTIRNRISDPFYGWSMAASTTAAFALAPPFVAPVLETQVHDILILTFFLLLYLGGQREMKLQRESYSREAAEEERRCLARELHDGLTQELVFIASQGNKLLRRTGVDGMDGLRQITSAAERAGDEARQAILTLSSPCARTTGEAAQELAEELVHRAGMTPSLDIDTRIELSSRASEQLLGILREAISNAARHGQARNVSVGLHQENGIVLEITDDGSGFDPTGIERRGRTGFGFVSMHERAHVLGGSLQISSFRNQGTKIRLEAPELELIPESERVALT